jgi:hypothetical protein
MLQLLKKKSEGRKKWEKGLLSRDCQSSEQFAGLNRRYDEMQAEFALVPLTISETSQEEEL